MPSEGASNSTKDTVYSPSLLAPQIFNFSYKTMRLGTFSVLDIILDLTLKSILSWDIANPLISVVSTISPGHYSPIHHFMICIDW